MKTTHYFRNSVMVRRPDLREEWIEAVLSHPVQTEVQANGRIRRWGGKQYTMPFSTVALSLKRKSTQQ